MEYGEESCPNVTRRAIIRGSALAGAALALAGTAALGSARADDGSAEAEIESTQYGFLVVTGNCIHCEKCVAACRKHSKTPADMDARRKVVRYESDFGKVVHASLSCMHCEEPSCMKVCPAGAISKRPDGIVVVNHNRCIGCKYCYQACPFGVPHYGKQGMDKCDCCLEAGIPAGDTPYCVQACMFGALKYGKLDELMALNHGTAHRVEASTKPACLLLLN